MPYEIGEEFAQEFNRLRNKVDSLNGHGVDNNSESITIQRIDTLPDVPVPKDDEMCLVAIIGTETGNGRYQGCIVTGASTGNKTDTFQLDTTPSLATVDGPVVSGTNNALVMNLQEMYVDGGHKLWSGNANHPIYAVGRIMGSTTETPPRTRVYIEGWPIRPVIAQITQDLSSASVPQGSTGGVYTGKILEGRFADAVTAYSSTLATLAAIHLPAAEDCWIVNDWEQTNIYPGGATAGQTIIPVGTVVQGFAAGFPLHAWDSGTRSATLKTFYMVYIRMSPQMPALSPAIQPIATSGSAGATYTAAERNMINSLKTDVTNIQASFKQFYINAQNNGYSL